MSESRLPETAEKLVARLIKADRRRKWQIRLLGVACTALIAVGLILGVWIIPAIQGDAARNAAYTNSVVQHECAALNLLTATPVTYPADPAANPSRVQNYKFYTSLVYWKTSDHCPN